MGKTCPICQTNVGSEGVHNYCWRQIAYWTRKCFNCVHFRQQTQVEQEGYVIGTSAGLWGSSLPHYRVECSCAKLGIRIETENADRCMHFLHKETAMNGTTIEQIDGKRNQIIQQLRQNQSSVKKQISNESFAPKFVVGFLIVVFISIFVVFRLLGYF